MALSKICSHHIRKDLLFLKERISDQNKQMENKSSFFPQSSFGSSNIFRESYSSKYIFRVLNSVLSKRKIKHSACLFAVLKEMSFLRLNAKQKHASFLTVHHKTILWKVNSTFTSLWAYRGMRLLCEKFGYNYYLTFNRERFFSPSCFFSKMIQVTNR